MSVERYSEGSKSEVRKSLRGRGSGNGRVVVLSEEVLAEERERDGEREGRE